MCYHLIQHQTYVHAIRIWEKNKKRNKFQQNKDDDKKVIDNKFVREFITLLSVSFPLDLTLKSPDNLCRNKCENIKSRCKKGEIFKQFKRKLLCQLITHLDFPRVQFIYFLQKVIVSYIKITTNTTHKKSLHVIHIRHQKSKKKKKNFSFLEALWMTMPKINLC